MVKAKKTETTTPEVTAPVSVTTDSTTSDQALLEKKAQILSIDERKNEIVRLWKLL